MSTEYFRTIICINFSIIIYKYYISNRSEYIFSGPYPPPLSPKEFVPQLRLYGGGDLQNELTKNENTTPSKGAGSDENNNK